MIFKFIQTVFYVLILFTTLFGLWPGESALAAGPVITPEQAVIQALGEVGANDFRLSDMGPNGNINYMAFAPAVAYNSRDNQYLVVWYGDDNSGGLVEGEYEIFGQAVNAATGAEIGGDFRISHMGPDGNTNYKAYNPAVAYNSQDNQYLVAWYGGFGEYEIYGQRLNAATRAPIGDHIRLSNMGPDGNTNYKAYNPAVAYNSANNQYLVVWYGDDNSGGLVDNEYEIFGQRVEGSTGSEIGGDFRISEMGGTGNAAYAAYDPAVAYNSAQNEYLVVWEGKHTGGGLVDNEYEIFGQRLNAATGAKISPNNVRLSAMGGTGNAAYEAHAPAVAYSSAANRYLVVWSGDHNSGGLVDEEFEIFSQLVAVLNGGGVATFGQLRLSSMGGTGNAAFDAYDPAVSYNSAANEFLVVWSGNTIIQFTDQREIFGQRVNPTDGAEIGDDTRLSDMGPDGNTNYGAFLPAVAANSANSEYLVVWVGDDDTPPLVNDEFEIFGQRFGVPANQRVFLPLVVK